MMKNGKCLLLCLLLLLLSCNKDKTLLECLEKIREDGDSDPQSALVELRALSPSLDNAALSTQMKSELLAFRLKDKAYIVPTSDSAMRVVYDYWEKQGDNREKQEASYYMGSVYRDLKDYPRALEYFLKAKDYAEGESPCDSVMLRNTYSNLVSVYYDIQDYANAVECAKI